MSDGSTESHQVREGRHAMKLSKLRCQLFVFRRRLGIRIITVFHIVPGKHNLGRLGLQVELVHEGHDQCKCQSRGGLLANAGKCCYGKELLVAER